MCDERECVPDFIVLFHESTFKFNLLKPPVYVIYHQFNIEQSYSLFTLYLYILYLSEYKQRLGPLTALTDRLL